MARSRPLRAALRRAAVRALLPGLFAVVSACAAPADAPTPSTESLRIQVETVDEFGALEPLSQRLAAVSGAAVRDPVKTMPRALSLTLVCASHAACEQALRRLAAERSLVAGVRPDPRRTVPSRPSSSSAR